MTRPNQITSSSVIHQLPVSPSLVVTNNDDIVQNSIQFLVQNSYSLLLSSFTNNYKCKPPFFFKYLCNHPFDLRYHLFLFYFWAAKRERNSSSLRSRKFLASGIGPQKMSPNHPKNAPSVFLPSFLWLVPSREKPPIV